MSRVMAVAAREIMARKLVFLTAPAWGVMVAVLGGLHHNPGSVFTAATICALVFTVVMGLVIGAALVGRELAEHRACRARDLLLFCAPAFGPRDLRRQVLGRRCRGHRFGDSGSRAITPRLA